MTPDAAPRIEALSAVTLATGNMGRSLAFYASLGFRLTRGGADAPLSCFELGDVAFNLIAQPHGAVTGWGRVIFRVSDVDAFHAQAVAAGLQPQDEPRDAPWGERFFHLTDPDGHELSFARPLAS
jgi:catechol 2,3-dioxygenase-like lactoylglutathione lyase family enzyme